MEKPGSGLDSGGASQQIEVSGLSVEYSVALLCFAGIYERYQTLFSLISADVDALFLRGLSVARIRSVFFYEQKGGETTPDSPKVNHSCRATQCLLWFVLEAACFSVSQPLLRIPLLGLLNHSMWFTMPSTLHPVLTMVIIGSSASVFEEGFRFLFKQFLLRPAKHTIAQPLLFGLGHGRIKAGLILTPLLMQGYTFSVLHMALIERVLVVPLHLILTVIVRSGFQTGHRFRYLAAAIVLHGLVDSVLPLLAYGGMQVVFVGLIFAGIVSCAGVYIVLSRKLYLQGGTENEEESAEA